MKSGDTDADIDVASNGRRRIVILTCLWAASNKKLLIYLPVIGWNWSVSVKVVFKLIVISDMENDECSMLDGLTC